MLLSYQKISLNGFHRLCEFIRANYGINLTEAKRNLVINRLNKRLRSTGLKTIDDYIRFVFSDKGFSERSHLCDYLSTNKTYFYREPSHFEFLNQFLTQLDKNKQLSIWSAASSSGDELYTISMLIHEFMKKNRYRLNYNLLGTDISVPMLEQAKKGHYDKSHVVELPRYLLDKYIRKTDDKKYPFQITDELKQFTSFKAFNLTKDLKAMSAKFDIIFCRNVLIYFKKELKEKIVQELITKIKPGGYLILGHCEGMIGRTMDVSQIQPGVFQKVSA